MRFPLFALAAIGCLTILQTTPASAAPPSHYSGYEITVVSVPVGEAADYEGKESVPVTVIPPEQIKQDLTDLGLTDLFYDPLTKMIRGTYVSPTDTSIPNLFSDAIPLQQGFVTEHLFTTTNPMSYGIKALFGFMAQPDAKQDILSVKLSLSGVTFLPMRGAGIMVDIPHVNAVSISFSLRPLSDKRNVTIFPGIYLDGSKAIMLGVAIRPVVAH